MASLQPPAFLFIHISCDCLSVRLRVYMCERIHSCPFLPRLFLCRIEYPCVLLISPSSLFLFVHPLVRPLRAMGWRKGGRKQNAEKKKPGPRSFIKLSRTSVRMSAFIDLAGPESQDRRTLEVGLALFTGSDGGWPLDRLTTRSSKCGQRVSLRIVSPYGENNDEEMLGSVHSFFAPLSFPYFSPIPVYPASSTLTSFNCSSIDQRGPGALGESARDGDGTLYE